MEPPLRDPAFVRLWANDEFALYHNPRALPRAFTVRRARFVVDTETALGGLVDGSVDARREVALVGTPTPFEAALTMRVAEDARPAHVAVDRPEHVVVDVAVTAASVLVLADAFAPGWHATVDGVPRRLWRANHLVRSVVVLPGERRVNFRTCARPAAGACGGRRGVGCRRRRPRDRCAPTG
jgi:hypothetical protein